MKRWTLRAPVAAAVELEDLFASDSDARQVANSRGAGRRVEQIAFGAVLPSLLTGAVAALATDSASTGCILALVIWGNRGRLSPVAAQMDFLPLMRRLRPVLVGGSLLGLIALMTALGLVENPGVVGSLCIIAPESILTAVAGVVRHRRRRGEQEALRVAIIGSATIADDLRDELLAMRRTDVRIVGHIVPPSEFDSVGGGELGRLGGLAAAIRDHQIDLLLLSDAAPRMQAFDEVAETCANSGVRMLELHAFYEQTFGHVPLGAINAAWFQWVMHPRYTVGVTSAKRALDLLISAGVSVVALPVIALLCLIVRTDGGPAFYRQLRVGERGEPFEILKLRSMRVADPSEAKPWTTADDNRVTRVGRVMRKSHLDELPQIFNVLRGEMSIVGPRPEQPQYVRQLEQAVPHYSRRSIIRPGVTGWAQVKCGYAGSDEGSTWKLSHDLYYLKHRSLALDLLILGETLRTLAADSQFDESFKLPAFVRQREAERLPEVKSILEARAVDVSDPVRT